jgi:hypothetical protein
MNSMEILGRKYNSDKIIKSFKTIEEIMINLKLDLYEKICKKPGGAQHRYAQANWAALRGGGRGAVGGPGAG